MKKFFLLISAVLLSLGMQATVVTQNFDLSGTSAYGTATVSGGSITDVAAWAGAQLWQWTEGALAYDQVVLEVADHAQKVLFRIQYSDETNVEKELPVGINTMAIDITQDIVKGVFVLNWSGEADVDITITGLYLRGGIGEKKEVTLWSGSEHFTAYKVWDEEVILAENAFADAHLGDILELNYTLDESYNQLQLYTSNNQYRPEFLRPLNEWNQYDVNKTNEPSQLRLAITNSTDLTKLQTNGALRINGINFTLTSVKLIRHDVLWSGTQSVGDNWSGGQSIAWSKLSSLQPGNILCVRVTEGSYEAEKYNQVLCTYKSDWSGAFSPSVNYQLQEGDEMPMIVEIPITHRMLHQLNGEQLNVGGRNYTMTDIFIKEGTPLTTKAAYLNVSAAGMATYVLPFNVPSLPAGVEAYNLTNDGTDEIVAEQVYALKEDKPVLIIADAGEYEFISEAGASDDVSSKISTYSNGALVGTYVAIDQLEQTTGGNYNYLLLNGASGVAFYQVKDNTCSVAPYRAYLSCGYNANAGGAGAPMRIRFKEDTTTGVESHLQSAVGVQKVLRDGQLYIIRDNKMYTTQGSIVK